MLPTGPLLLLETETPTWVAVVITSMLLPPVTRQQGMMLTFTPRQNAVNISSEDGSADEGVTVVDSPTNCKSQSSPIIKSETA